MLDLIIMKTGLHSYPWNWPLGDLSTTEACNIWLYLNRNNFSLCSYQNKTFCEHQGQYIIKKIYPHLGLEWRHWYTLSFSHPAIAFGSEISEVVQGNASGESSIPRLPSPPCQARAAKSVTLVPATCLVLLFHLTPHLPHHTSDSSLWP